MELQVKVADATAEKEVIVLASHWGLWVESLYFNPQGHLFSLNSAAFGIGVIDTVEALLHELSKQHDSVLVTLNTVQLPVHVIKALAPFYAVKEGLVELWHNATSFQIIHGFIAEDFGQSGVKFSYDLQKYYNHAGETVEDQEDWDFPCNTCNGPAKSVRITTSHEVYECLDCHEETFVN